MSVQTDIVIISNDDMSQSNIKKDTLSPKESIESLAVYLNKLVAGCGSASVDMRINRIGGVAASGTVTLSSFANNDTVTIGNQVFTAKTSGASGNNQFNLGADDTAAAAALAVKVNAHPSLTNVISAVSALGVVTVSAVPLSASGNMFGLAISAHGSVSGAYMTGGVAATSYIMHAGV